MKKNDEFYRSRMETIDFASAAPILGLALAGDRFRLDFFGRTYFVSRDGIQDESGTTPDYGICVILAKYVILFPDRAYLDGPWCAFRDFRKESHFLTVNYFASDTEKFIADAVAGKIDKREHGCVKLGGEKGYDGFAYDLVVGFTALPRISFTVAVQ